MSPTHNPDHQQAPADDEPYARQAAPKDGKPDQLCEEERRAGRRPWSTKASRRAFRPAIRRR